MFRRLVVATAVLAVGLGGCTYIPSGRTTCGDFVTMGPSRQKAAIAKVLGDRDETVNAHSVGTARQSALVYCKAVGNERKPISDIDTEPDRPDTGPANRDIPRIPTMVILDASGSMKADDAPGVRFTAARRAVHALVEALPDGFRVGLLAYGTSTGSSDAEAEAGCQDITEPVRFGALDRKQFNDAVDELKPRGYTPIGLALREAAERLPASDKRAIVLVSDGIDTCAEEDLGPDPCDVAKGIADDLTIHTVGFKLEEDESARQQLACISTATGGLDLDASNSGQLRSRLVAAFSPESSSASLRPDGYRGLTPGMTIAQARKAAPKLGRISERGRVEVLYVDCTLVFNDGVLVQIETASDGVATLDGVRVGEDIQVADRLYRNREYPPVVEKGYITYPGDIDLRTGYRIYFNQDGDKLAGEITRIIVCMCMPGPQSGRLIVLNPDIADHVEFDGGIDARSGEREWVTVDGVDTAYPELPRDLRKALRAELRLWAPEVGNMDCGDPVSVGVNVYNTLGLAQWPELCDDGTEFWARIDGVWTEIGYTNGEPGVDGKPPCDFGESVPGNPFSAKDVFRLLGYPDWYEGCKVDHPDDFTGRIAGEPYPD